MKYSKDKYNKSCSWDRLIFPCYRLGIDWKGPAKQQAKHKSGERSGIKDI